MSTPGRDETIKRVERAAGKIATLSVARMDDELRWFRNLPADQRSWVSLVAQAGIASYVEWLRSPDDVLRLTGEVFGTAPRELASSVSLQQTVELVQKAIEVTEEQLPLLTDRPDGPEAIWLANELLKFSREVAFAAARVYATVAETRGAWDARLEAMVIDGLVRGSPIPEAPLSQLAALGWRTEGPITAVVGAALDHSDLLAEVHRSARHQGLDAMAAVHGTTLVVVLGGVDDPMTAARTLLEHFDDGPVVVGPATRDFASASIVTQAALSGLRAATAWPGAPRPVEADRLLAERVLAGDAAARDELIDTAYRPLVAAGDVVVETLAAFLESGGALEATARALFVHVNTVRYRLRRISEICGLSPTNPRDAHTLRVALILGRLGGSTGS